MDDETTEGQYVTVERQWLWLYTAVSRVGSTKRVWSCRRKSLNSFNQRVFLNFAWTDFADHTVALATKCHTKRYAVCMLFRDVY